MLFYAVHWMEFDECIFPARIFSTESQGRNQFSVSAILITVWITLPSTRPRSAFFSKKNVFWIVTRVHKRCKYSFERNIKVILNKKRKRNLVHCFFFFVILIDFLGVRYAYLVYFECFFHVFFPNVKKPIWVCIHNNFIKFTNTTCSWRKNV